MVKKIEPLKTGQFVIDEDTIRRLLTTVDAGLSSGLGVQKPGHMCVEAAVCYALNLPHSDEPKCVAPIIRSTKIGLNDSAWSSKTARADGLRKLSVLQLGTLNNFDEVDFAKRLALKTIKTVLPLALSAIGLHDHAASCTAVTTLEEGIKASDAAMAAAFGSPIARYAVQLAKSSASDADHVAAWAASDAVTAAKYAARVAKIWASDHVLKTFAVGVENILIEMKVPAIRFLPLLDAPSE